MEIVKNNKGGSKLCFEGTFDVAPLLFQQALVPTICVSHGTEDSVVLSEHPTLLYGKH